jgi:general secretion pathway protein H
VRISTNLPENLGSESSRGFTLIEIMIVVAIIAAIMGLALPKIKKQNSDVKAIMRQLSVLSIEVRHYAELKNATYRIAFNMNGKQDSYYVEASNRTVLVKSEDAIKREQDMSKEDGPASPFSKVDKPLKEEKKLAEGVIIKSVETKSHKDAVTHGMAYIHYSPEGLVEQAIVQISNGKNATWSLIFNPLTGHADMVDKPVSLKDLEVQP